MKLKLNSRHFDTVEEIQPKLQVVVDALTEQYFLGVL